MGSTSDGNENYSFMSEFAPPDDYSLGRNGEINLVRRTNDSFDRLINFNGTKFINLQKDFMKSMNQSKVYSSFFKKYKPDETTVTFENSSISTKQIKNYFYFLAANTEVEWGFNHLEKKGWFSNSTVTIIGSNHKDSEVSMSPVFKYLEKGYSLLGSGHSHPFLIYDHPVNTHLFKGRYDAISYPSGFNMNGTIDYNSKYGDRITHDNLLNKYPNQIKSNPWIYLGNPDSRPNFIYYDTTSFRKK